MPTPEIQQIEMRLLLEGLFQVYGHDFRDYAEASLHRRLHKWLAEVRLPTFSEAQGRLLRDPALCRSLVQGLTVHVTEMFRDPSCDLQINGFINRKMNGRLSQSDRRI